MTMLKWYFSLQGFNLTRAGKELDEVPRSSRERLDAWSEQGKWEIAKYHFGNNPLFQKKIGRVLPERWEDLPMMNKPDFQQDLRSIISKGFVLSDLYVSNTSGSSGHPFFFAKDKPAHARTWALVIQRYGWHGISLESKQARFYGIPLERLSYAKEKMKDMLMHRVRFPVFDMSDSVLERFVERFRRIPFEYVYGYTNSLILFCRYLLQQGIRLNECCPTLKACVTTSEVCTPEDREILTRAFGVKVVNEYGASEVGIIAFENSCGEWVISEENLFVEVVDDAGRPVPDGDTGDILVTDLHNRAIPLVRYRIGDVGIVDRRIAASKDVRKKMVALQGRTNDTIFLPSGKKSPGFTFYYVSRSILESSGVLKEFIIRQTGLDEFVFDIVSDRPLTSAEEAQIREKMELYLEPGLRLTINRVPAIKRPPSGRIKHFYSELPRQG